MKNSGSLYNLITSLSGSEKSYFRKYAKRHTIGEKNVYLRLYEMIERIKDPGKYNEDQLRSGLENYSGISNFSVLKSYLYKMILKSMEAYHSGSSKASLINSLVENFRFLNRKKLYREAFAVLRKAKKIARDYELTEKLYEIIKFERAMIKNIEPGNVELQNIANVELVETADKLSNIAQYTYLNDTVISLSSQYGLPNTEQLNERFDEIMKSEYLKSSEHAKTFFSLLYFYQIHATYHFKLSQYEKCLDLYNASLLHMESNKYMMEHNPRNYAIMVLNCLDMCDILKNYHDYDIYYAKYTEFMKKLSKDIPESAKMSIVSRVYILEIRKFTTMGDFDEKKREIIDIATNVEQNMSKFAHVDRVILTFQFAMYYFGCGNYNESLKWLNQIINNDDEVRRDLRTECKMLFLIIHFELKNYDFLEYAVKSTYRYLLKFQTLKGIEPLILYFIKKIASISNENELKELFEELRQKMIRNKEIVDEYGFKYLYWVESRLSGTTYAEIMKRKFSEAQSPANAYRNYTPGEGYYNTSLQKDIDDIK